MTPEDRRALVRKTAEEYYADFGEWVETTGQEALVDHLRRRVNPAWSAQAFEDGFVDILRIHERRYQAADSNSWLPDGDRGPDLERIEQDLTAAINSIA